MLNDTSFLLKKMILAQKNAKHLIYISSLALARALVCLLELRHQRPCRGVLFHVDSVVLHAARSTLLSAWQVLDAAHRLFRTEVDDEEVWEVRTLRRLPVG